MTQINLAEQINTAYHQAYYDDRRFLVLHGGAGSGKSVFATQKIIIRCLAEGKHRFLVLRKVARTIKRSVFQLFKDILSSWGLLTQCKVNNTDFSITIPSPSGESQIMFAGMDDPEKIKSIAGVTGIWCEETTEFEKGDIDQLNLRLRGETANYKQIILSFNPINETHWLKERYFDKPSDQVTTLKTTYRNNRFLDAEYIAELEDLINQDENLHRIYVLGEWGVIRTGEEFFHKFKRSIHVGSYEPSQEVTPVFAIDYNNRPYMTLVRIEKRRNHIENGRPINAYIITREYCKKPPATVETLVEWVVDDSKVRVCYWVDDPSGKNEAPKKTRQEVKSLSAQVAKTFVENGVGASKIKLRKAPPLRTRKMAWTKLLVGHNGWHIRIDDRCKNTILDFETLQEDTSGAWVKKKVRDKEKNVTYEEGGHIADALTYYFCTEFPDLFSSGKPFGF